MNTLRSVILPLLHGLPSHKVRAVGGEDVWRLYGYGAEVEALRTQLLRSVLGSGARLVLLYEEELDEPEIESDAVVSGAGVFELRPSIAVGPLRRWLSLGNWRMLSPGAPPRGMDIARGTPDKIQGFMREHGLDFIIDSFHDDAPWTVALGEESPDGQKERR